MGLHSETASRNSVEAALERLSKRADEGFDNIDRRLRRSIWKIAGLYAYLMAWLIWFYFDLRS